MKPAVQKTTDSAKEPYNNLKHFFAHAQSLFHIKSILGMDMMTNMPRGGLAQRINDIASLTKRIYAETITKQVQTALESAESDREKNPVAWSEWDKRNLEEMRWMYDNLAAVPPELFLASIRASNEGRLRHNDALKNNDWNGVKPWLKDVIELTRRSLTYKQKLFGTRSHYETLLRGYARDMSEKDIDTLLDKMASPLRSIMDEAVEKRKSMPLPKKLEKSFSRDEQLELFNKILADMGFDFDRGSITTTQSAAAAGGHRNETRMLIRSQDHGDLLTGVEDTLYQGAKCVYIQGLPEQWLYQPVGNTPEIILIDAHSLLMETMIGHSPYFLTYLVNTATKMHPHWASKGFDAENLYRLKNALRPAANETDADELTRLMQKTMRVRIEKDLINGALKVDDLPERWAADTEKTFGIRPKNPAQELLQSPAWYTGRFGYLSATLLAHAGAAQLEDALFSANKNLAGQIEKGDFSGLMKWLRTNLYEKGRLKGGLALIEDASGHKLTEKPLLNHLRRRFLNEKA